MVITTPPASRRDLVLEAIGRGVAVVADKPFAPSAVAAAALASAADGAGVLLNVFHNRRDDTDIVTARAVIESGELGRVGRLDLRADQDEPGSLEGGPDGGLLRDLGSHVVDQAIHLIGPAVRVTAHLDWVERPAGRTDSAFVLTIEHESGAHSHVSATKLGGVDSRELRLFGERGSYRSDYSDVQVVSVRAGDRPEGRRLDWGYEAEARWGTLSTNGHSRAIPSLQGDYTNFYDRLAEAVVTGGPGPVPAAQGVEVLRVLDGARLSAAEHRTVTLSEL